MTKPHWQVQHEWWEEDFAFWKGQRDAFAEMLRRHPEDDLSPLLRDILKVLDKEYKSLQIKYKKIYGVRFNSR